jgi:hypothetical protein
VRHALFERKVISSLHGGRVSGAIARKIGWDVETGGITFPSSNASPGLGHMASLNRRVETVAKAAVQVTITRSTQVDFHQCGQIVRAGSPPSPA